MNKRYEVLNGNTSNRNVLLLKSNKKISEGI